MTVVLVVAVGCIDDEIVFRDQELFNPSDRAGFLGYADVGRQLTTCGGCHQGKQAEWEATGHASAWVHLQASGRATAQCEPCHSVSDRGNAELYSGEYVVEKNAAYHDVQCESCHGPGLAHIGAPELDNKPLASIAVDTGLTNGCGECHSTAAYPYAEEWRNSPHGYGGWDLSLLYWQLDPCKNCHEGREALRITFGGLDPRVAGHAVGDEHTVYLERPGPGLGPKADAQPQVCAVCHDPHDGKNDGQLRAPGDEATLGQVCVMCHRRDGQALSGRSLDRGTHGAQGLVVIDQDVGWKPATWSAGRFVEPHGEACTACHVTPFEIKDGAGKVLRRYTGHLFEAIPCLNSSTGLPVAEGTCADAQRYFGGCAVSGCHASAAEALEDFQDTRARMNELTDQLWFDTDRDNLMEASDAGLLPKVLAEAAKTGERNWMNLYDTVLTDAEGAIYNAWLAFTEQRSFWTSFKIAGQNACGTPGCGSAGGGNTSHKASGEGTHNPGLLEALLIESIQAVQITYGVAPSRPVDLSPRLGGH